LYQLFDIGLIVHKMVVLNRPCFVQAIDFLDKLLRYDHQERLTAKEAQVCATDAANLVRVE
jgi:hypothetical protein